MASVQEQLETVNGLINDGQMETYINEELQSIESKDKQEKAKAQKRLSKVIKVVDQDKDLSSERLGLINAVLICLSNGLALLGLSRPEKM